MDLKWDLSPLYTDIESEEFKNDIINYEKETDKLNSWAEINLNDTSNKKEKLEYYIKEKNKLSEYNKLSLYLNLLISTDTSNSKVLKKIDFIEAIETKLTKHEVYFISFLKKTDNMQELINSSEILKEHEYFLKESKEYSNHILKPAEEEIIAKMKNTGSKLFEKQWEQLSSNLLADIEINGEKKQLPLSVIRNYAYEADPKLRKSAYESELKAYKKIETSAAFSLNGIKSEVLTVTEIRNYKSPLDMTLSSSRMDAEILNTMFKAIKENIPSIQKYFIKKAKMLGHKNGLPFYDLFAPIGKTDMKFTYNEAKDFVIKNFTSFSKKLGGFAEQAFNDNWIDVLPKEGKVGGAFCEGIHSIKQSRILTNFTGSFNDVVTLAHELGHAYHDSCLYNESELNCEYPMPIAETASTFCETIIINSALKTATADEAVVILENDISGIAQVIIDIYSRFLFEDELFRKRKSGFVSSNELNEIMINAQKESYGHGLDHRFLHPYMWVCKPHYYDADFNYYNFPYSFGLLFAKGLYAKYLNDGDSFVSLYDKMLSITGKNSLADAAKLCGIDLHDINFWRSSFDIINKEISEFINL